VKPQKIVWDVRECLGPEDIAISDVGAHKMWMSRMYRAERPNTCIISNGFAAMGSRCRARSPPSSPIPTRR
jgi:acetolactate synthase-1/2/3 large subunit